MALRFTLTARRTALCVVAVFVVGSCSSRRDSSVTPVFATAPVIISSPATDDVALTEPASAVEPTTTIMPTTTTTTTTTTTAPVPTTTANPVETTAEAQSPPLPGQPFALPGVDVASSPVPHLADAYNRLLDHNLAVSVSVWRDQAKIFGAANGLTPGWQLVTTDTPMVLASVSKLITALSIARLAQTGLVNIDQPVDWDAIGIAHHPTWNDVTVRELLAHTSGMPIVRNSWFDTPGACTVPLTEAMSAPPRQHRSRWTYSNGNYCALGLLIESVTGRQLDEAAQELIFDLLGISGPHLTIEPQPDLDGPYILGLARLQRLGGAGTWMGSTDDMAVMLGAVTALDRQTLISPGIITDQYGWGHTGTIDGAKACAWIMENGRTVVTAFVSGNSPATGGEVCDIILPALATDLGLWADRPIREP